MSVSGDVAQPGVHLVPFGSSFADLLEACGGMAEGEGVMAFAPGGAGCELLAELCGDAPAACNGS